MFATVFVLLYAAHLLADYAIQTDHQAAIKDKPGRAGWIANLTHAASHVASCAVALAAGAAVLDGLQLPVWRGIGAVAWIGVTHSFIDRRWPIAWWMTHTGSGPFYRNGGAAHVYQTAHVLALTVAAFIIAS